MQIQLKFVVVSAYLDQIACPAFSVRETKILAQTQIYVSYVPKEQIHISTIN